MSWNIKTGLERANALIGRSAHGVLECWSSGVLVHWRRRNHKHQISGFQVSGVRKKKDKR